MIDVDKAVIARMKKQGHDFEILVDCNNALALKTGKTVEINDVLASTAIFSDVKKGLKASDADLNAVFNSTDVQTVALAIIKGGEIQLTSQHREKLREEKKKRIINIIHRNAIDSKTGLPHPPQRIEAAIEEAGVHIDEFKGAEEQVESTLKRLRVIIPIKFEKKEVEVKLPAQYAGQAYGILKKHKVLKDEWLPDGSLLAIVEIPSGIIDEFFETLNNISHGGVESKILKVIE